MMNKPKPECQVFALDWNECSSYIIEKYNIDLDDYDGTWAAGDYETPRKDFNMWLHETGFFSNSQGLLPSKGHKPWQQEILNLFDKEFGEYKDDFGLIPFYLGSYW